MKEQSEVERVLLCLLNIIHYIIEYYERMRTGMKEKLNMLNFAEATCCFVLYSLSLLFLNSALKEAGGSY
jgi:hypothetical protein